MLQAGSPSPDPGAYNQKAAVINLRYFPGQPFLVFFYESDDTNEALLQEFQSLHPKIKELNTVLVGISRDSMLTHRATVETLNIDYHLLADLDAKACRRFEVLAKGEEDKPARPALFIIGPDGIVWYSSDQVNPTEAVDKLKELVAKPPEYANATYEIKVTSNVSDQKPPETFNDD